MDSTYHTMFYPYFAHINRQRTIFRKGTLVAAVVAGSRAEEGCVYYELGKSNTPLTYAFIEVWKSQDAINTHNETAHFKTFVEAINGKADLSVCVTNRFH
ncbi:putative quinol monooxygenase [Massilibacteroides vaginae]|jgi:quinol monooxygenase YgiN|uniref:putative quinol monooxygenase n=1 Tax=Massilibacteroides vaginae TaxID=1673718 RepID=UPI000A1CCAA7|nr:putative quinol monooxygenase [Massilibacteroides vaginae]